MTLRVIIKHKRSDKISGAEWSRLETKDIECPELEQMLASGGLGTTGYDLTELVGIEVRR